MDKKEYLIAITCPTYTQVLNITAELDKEYKNASIKHTIDVYYRILFEDYIIKVKVYEVG